VVAKDELDNLLAHNQLGKRVPLLFLANKMDLPTALAPVELAQVGPATAHTELHKLVLCDCQWGWKDSVDRPVA
jgi:hypothetical protein